MLENANEFILHGYAYRDWIREIPSPHANVGKYGPVGGIDLNRAMSVVYNEVSAMSAASIFATLALSSVNCCTLALNSFNCWAPALDHPPAAHIQLHHVLNILASALEKQVP